MMPVVNNPCLYTIKFKEAWLSSPIRSNVLEAQRQFDHACSAQEVFEAMELRHGLVVSFLHSINKKRKHYSNDEIEDIAHYLLKLK